MLERQSHACWATMGSGTFKLQIEVHKDYKSEGSSYIMAGVFNVFRLGITF